MNSHKDDKAKDDTAKNQKAKTTKPDQVITSKDNPLFKKLKLLLSSKGIKEHKLFFLMGEKLIKEFTKTKNKKFKVHLAVCSEKYFAKYPFNTIILSQDLFNELDTLGTHFPMLVLECDDFPEADLKQPATKIEVVLPIGDPRNMGALVRSAIGFNIDQFVLTQEACHPFLPQSVKASAGAILKADFYSAPGKTTTLPVIGANFALDLEGKPLQQITWPEHFRLWIGEEGPGLQTTDQQKKQFKFINIPTQNIESLNATVSASIAFWEIAKSK